MKAPIPQLEKTFNRAILRAFAITTVAIMGVLGVGFLFWSIRHIIPFSLAIVLFCIGALAWLFGAQSLIEVVGPDEDAPEARSEDGSAQGPHEVLPHQ